MKRPLALASAALAAALLLPKAGIADEPGPGGQKPVVPVTGEQIYRAVCQACHMADAKGATGAATIPALAGDAKLAEAGYPILMVANGHGAMPWFNGDLTPAQMAAVITYVRTHFGNNYADPVSAADVTAVAGPPPSEDH